MKRKSFVLFWWLFWVCDWDHEEGVGFFGGIGRVDLKDVRPEDFWDSFNWIGI
jgi:hypothetical protein